MKFRIFLLLLMVSATSYGLFYSSPKNAPMAVSLNASDDYASYWKKVDSLDKKGLPKDALAIVSMIKASALKEKNMPQFLKASIYTIKLRSDFEENYLTQSIQGLEREVAVTPEPAKQILHSILGDLYWNYYSQNQYRINSRTNLADGAGADMETWDAASFIRKSVGHFNASLQNPALLEKTELNLYDPIIVKSPQGRKLRPTLYDFLAHRAIDFYGNNRARVTQPIDPFTINRNDYFSDAEDFAKLRFDSNDTSSFHYYALRTFQQLLQFRLKADDVAALVDADLKRLGFVYQEASMAGKDSLYIEALKRLQQKYASDPASADVIYTLARTYYTLAEAQSYDKATPPAAGKNYYQRAHELCSEAVTKFPSSPGAANCAELRREIERPFLNVQSQQYLSPDMEAPGRLEFRNLNTVHFRIVKRQATNFTDPFRSDNSSVKTYLNRPVVKEWTLNLPEGQDFARHATEFILPPLNMGSYVLLASQSATFSLKDVIAHKTLQVTSLSLVGREEGNDAGGRVFVLHRETGKGIAGAKVNVYNHFYDYQLRRDNRKLLKSVLAGADGSADIGPLDVKTRVNSTTFEVLYGNDRLDVGYLLNLYPYGSNQPENRTQTWFFTDRAIYRPGQTVYFKGIVTTMKGESDKAIANSTRTVTFYDANGQKVSTLDLRTNEFGSFSGQFSIPTGGLSGSYRLETNDGNSYFQVEEYKRPNFEVTFDKITEAYKLNEKVTVNGKATTYSGVPLGDARVNYRVVRSTFYPWPVWGWRFISPRSASAEIANGTLVTDEKGGFSISFDAKSDPNESSRYQPAYRYQVTADVTDINGETHTGNTTVIVGPKALILDVQLADNIDRDKPGNYPVISTNMSGENTPAAVDVRIEKLKPTERLLRERLWEEPDVASVPPGEWYGKLPHDPYMNDHVQTNRVEKTVQTTSLNTSTDSTLVLNGIAQWEPGTYLVTLASKDAFGEEVKVQRSFVLFDRDSKKIPENKYIWYHIPEKEVQPGSELTLLVGSAAPDARVLYEVMFRDGTRKSQWLEIGGKQQKIAIPIPEKYHGNVIINLLMVNHNRVYTAQETAIVPLPSRKLDIAFETFRTDLLPGSDEIWKLKIKGPDGEKTASELLVGMYDASLDAYVKHQWNFSVYDAGFNAQPWVSGQLFQAYPGNVHYPENYHQTDYTFRTYDQLNWFGFNTYYGGGIRVRGMNSRQSVLEEVAVTGMAMDASEYNMKTVPVPQAKSADAAPSPAPQPEMRRNLQETAFFFPQLLTDDEGNVEIRFTAPEALTRWNFMGLAHTPDLKFARFTREVVTRKEVMVTPNLPRFMREGDRMVIQSRISNLTDNPIQGEARLEILDALTLNPVDARMENLSPAVPLEAGAKANTSVEWKVAVPQNLDAVIVRISAAAGNHTDGEERMLPVLTNRMLVTETFPLPVNGPAKKEFTFTKFANASAYSPTLRNHRLTLEFTSNPAWYAVQALPYLAEPKYDHTTELFRIFYANSLASYIANSSPKMRNIFDVWRNMQPGALQSNLEKNQELKSVLLEETPWVTEAQGESAQKRLVGELFDQAKLKDRLALSLRKLQQRQTHNGGWVWFEGMPESRFITQEIITGFGKLHYLKVIDLKSDPQLQQMVQRGVNFLAEKIVEDYKELHKNRKPEKEGDYLSPIHIRYLYALSYLNGVASTPESARNEVAFYSGMARKHWLNKSLFQQGMIGLWAGRAGDKSTAGDIIASLKNKAMESDELGMYWRDNVPGYFWYQAPVETQATLIELFEEIASDKASADKMRTWLIKQKQTQMWPSNSATADAIYALLIRGTDWLHTDPGVTVNLGGILVDPANMPDAKAEAGTGYIKTSWSGSDIKPGMGHVRVDKTSTGPAWGALYWQYFEDIDKVTAHDGPLKIRRELFLRKNSRSGPVLEKITSSNPIEVGQTVIVRVELRTDRDLEFVHLKDLRAAAFEPVTALSGYRWRGGLGYYETMKDVSNNFFFERLPKGTWVFEYPLVVNQKGNYSAGVTSVQCLYASEFSAHSEGIRVEVK